MENATQAILETIISRIVKIENRIDTILTQNEINGVDVVNGTEEIEAPFINQIVLDKSTLTFYVFDDSSSWVEI